MARADSVSSFESEQKKPAVIKERSGKSTLKGLVYGFGAATCYGLLLCAVKLLYKISTVTVFEILYLRSLVAMIIVSFILYYLKVSPFEIKRHVALCLSIRCITGFLGFATEFFAVKFTELSKIVIILYNPFLTSLMSFLIIGERVNRQDLLSFFLGVTGIALLTDPFSDLKGINDFIGCSLAVLSAIIFNLGFIAIRTVKSKLNSWQIVFYFTVTNMMFSPFSFIGEKALSEKAASVYYDFEPTSFLIISLIGVLTVVGNFCVNKTLFYEKAGRATAYYNMELLYTFLFDIFVVDAQFSGYEIVGVMMIVGANLYMYYVNSK